MYVCSTVGPVQYIGGCLLQWEGIQRLPYRYLAVRWRMIRSFAGYHKRSEEYLGQLEMEICFWRIPLLPREASWWWMLSGVGTDTMSAMAGF